MSNSRTSILVLGVLLLLVAMFAINRVPGLNPPVVAENRSLAGIPDLPVDAKGLGKYREDMDAYVADNFPARLHLISLVNYIRYRLGYSGTSRVAVGKDGWLFYDNGSHLSQARPSTIDSVGTQAWIGTLAARTELLKSQGITYLVVAPPVKEGVYADKAPGWARAEGGSTDAELLASIAAKVGLENLIALRSALTAARESEPRIYSKYDIHWTGLGAYVGYVELLGALKRLGHRLEPLPLAHFPPVEKPVPARPQDVAFMLGIASFVEQDFPQFEDSIGMARAQVRYLTSRQDWTGDRVIETGNPGKPTIQLIGDSFLNELLPFLYPHFSRLIVSHHELGFFRQDLTEAYRPDIVVLEVLESGLRHAMSPGLAPPLGIVDRIRAVPATVQVLAEAAAPAAPNTGTLRMTPRERLDVRSVVSTSPGVSLRCNLEALAVVESAGTRRHLQATGWIADVGLGRVAPHVELVLQSPRASYTATAKMTVDRPDVVQYFAKPTLSDSGFSFELDADVMEPGVYESYLVQRLGGTPLTCVTNRTLALE